MNYRIFCQQLWQRADTFSVIPGVVRVCFKNKKTRFISHSVLLQVIPVLERRARISSMRIQTEGFTRRKKIFTSCSNSVTSRSIARYSDYITCFTDWWRATFTAALVSVSVALSSKLSKYAETFWKYCQLCVFLTANYSIIIYVVSDLRFTYALQISWD